jgi:hypothetical protein
MRGIDEGGEGLGTHGCTHRGGAFVRSCSAELVLSH